MKRILLLCIGMMSLTSNAIPISDIIKEHKTSIGLSLAAVGCASLAYHFHRKTDTVIVEKDFNAMLSTTLSGSSNIIENPNTHPYHVKTTGIDPVKYTYARIPKEDFERLQKYRAISLLGASAFAGLGIFAYLHKK